MVARPDRPSAGRRDGHDPVTGLFHAWRRIVTSGARAPGAAAGAVRDSRLARAARLTVRYAADPAGTLAASDSDDRERLKEAGAALLVVGATAAFAVSLALGNGPLRSFLAMGWTAAWALARLLLVRLALESPGGRRVAADAWGPALAPYVGAIVFPLDLIALAASAVLTHRGLSSLGVPRDRATRAVAWAFGGQLAAETLAWIGRAGLLGFVRI